MSELAFDKIVGTGNDFLFFDLRDSELGAFTNLSKRDLVIRAARRHTGVGADGVVFVERNAGDPDLKWDFFNNDGSQAEMCGNALRCMGRWARERTKLDAVRFLTIRGPVEVRYADGEFFAEMSFLRLEPRELRYALNGRQSKATFINTGVPHAVVEVESIHDVASRTGDISALRFHSAAGAEGANVTFFQRKSPTEFSTVTFERGVENFTLSCGTGVLASAAVALGFSHASPPTQPAEVRLETPGGKLRVRFEAQSENVILIGPATYVCGGRLAQEILK